MNHAPVEHSGQIIRLHLPADPRIIDQYQATLRNKITELPPVTNSKERDDTLKLICTASALAVPTKYTSRLKTVTYVDGWSLTYIAYRAKYIMTNQICKKLNPNNKRKWSGETEIRDGIAGLVDHWERVVRGLKWPLVDDEPPPDPLIFPKDGPRDKAKALSRNKDSKLMKKIDPAVWAYGTSVSDWKLLKESVEELRTRCKHDAKILKKQLQGRKRSDIRKKMCYHIRIQPGQ